MKANIRYNSVERFWDVDIFDEQGCVGKFVLSVDKDDVKCVRGTMFKYRKQIYDDSKVSEIMDALCDAIEENLTKNFVLIPE